MKRSFRQLVSVATLVVFVAALVGCGGDSDDDSGNAPSTPAGAVETQPRRGYGTLPPDAQGGRRLFLEQQLRDCREERSQPDAPYLPCEKIYEDGLRRIGAEGYGRGY